MNALRQLWLLIRDKMTFWWLVSVCECPEAALVYLNKQMREES